MTSEQAMRALLLALLACVSVGCDMFNRYPPLDPLVAPYSSRRVWAVVPLRNETGSLQADSVRMAEQLARQLENARNIDVLPLNRVLGAMEALQMSDVRTTADAMKLMGVLACDGLIIGTMTHYDPYDPPKLGFAIELYTSPRIEAIEPMDARALSYAGTEGAAAVQASKAPRQPVSTISLVLDAADPDTRNKLERYGQDRGPDEKDKRSWRRYRISMDLFSEFAAYVAGWRLMQAETQRITPPATQPASSGRTNGSTASKGKGS